MKQWNPTEPGTYLMNGVSQFVTFNGHIPQGAKVIHFDETSNVQWSLTAPNWQEGAPNQDQLGKWKWWAVQCYDGSMLIDSIEESIESVGYLRMCGGLELDPAHVKRSAPIQPDLSNGPLWVPLEVCK